MIQAIQIDIPQDVMLALKIPQQRIKATLTEELAVYLYAQGYVSYGKARKLANLTKWEFAERLGTRGIPRHYTEQDLEEDRRFATDNL